MEDIKVSIVIPAYNVQEYIEKCIDSLLQQTYHNIEIIIVNDGSNDATAAILNECTLRDNRIKVIHKENGGVTSARIRGVVESSGDYIGFVDADDYVETNMFQKLVHNAIKYQADISHCGYIMVFPNGRKDYYYNTGKILLQNNDTGIRDLIEGKIIEPGLWNKIFKRSLFKKLIKENKMDLTIKNNEDVLMNYYLFKESQMAIFEDVCLYHYLVRKGSATNAKRNRNQLCDPIKVSRIMVEDLSKENNVVLKELAEYRLTYQLINLIAQDSREDRALIKPIQKKALKELREKAFSIINRKSFGIRLRAMMVCAIISPTLYRLIHKVYAKAIGSDKKYDKE